MNKIIAVGVTAVVAASLSGHTCAASPLGSLADIQGAWWSSCDAAAAEFVIGRGKYSGDFVGHHDLHIKGNVLTFTHGLLEGHGVYVSGKPVAFRIIRASRSELVLRRLKDAGGNDWRLRRCEHAA